MSRCVLNIYAPSNSSFVWWVDRRASTNRTDWGLLGCIGAAQEIMKDVGRSWMMRIFINIMDSKNGERISDSIVMSGIAKNILFKTERRST